MLRGDSTHLTVTVDDNAKLGLITQGSNRVYSPRPLIEEDEETNAAVNNHSNDADYATSGDDLCEARLDVSVGKGATFVYAPDPCALYARSCFLQNQEVRIHPESSIAMIDWFSSGRYMNDERWEFDQLCTRTRLEWIEEDDNNGSLTTGTTTKMNTPFLQDTIAMDLRRSPSNDFGANVGMNCFASLILYGEHVQPIVNRCLNLSDVFASQHTRVRSRGHVHDTDDGQLTSLETTKIDHTSMTSSNETTNGFIDHLVKSLGSGGQRRVVMGVTQVPCEGRPSDACLVRLAATTNEDLYRIFHHVLLPMKESFGMEFYKERIRARNVTIPNVIDNADIATTSNKRNTTARISKSSGIVSRKSVQLLNAKYKSGQINSSSNVPDDGSETFWSILMLADSSLPTGSFAHSAGLEAAAQLGIISNEQDVEAFVQAAARSTMQLLTSFLIAGRNLATDSMMDNMERSPPEEAIEAELTKRWHRINQECQAVMSTNGPACAASIDQGKSLARVASEWIAQSRTDSTDIDDDNLKRRKDRLVLRCLKSSNGAAPHIGPTLGLIGGLLGLDDQQVCRLFAYCMSRDIVSASVRLSLVGPLASVSLLHKVRQSAEDGIQTILPLIDDCRDNPLIASASSAPVIEAIQPCHESLQVRLFRS